MAAIDNNESAVKETKRPEDYKSPGRLIAEEKAERIRIAEEYRRKLEAENATVAPKKTKAAEQKEQEKIEKAEREQAQRQALLEEETRASSQHVSDATERIEALMEKIERTEAELAAARDASEEKAAPENEKAEPGEPIEMDDLVVKIPVVSFTVPCAVKRKKQSAPAVAVPPPMMSPAVYITNVINVPEKDETQNCLSEQSVLPEQTPFKPERAKPRFTFVAPPAPSVKKAPKAKPAVRAIDVTSSFKKNDAYKPAITYGNTVSDGGWEDEFEDEVDIPDAETDVPSTAQELDLISNLALASDEAEASALEVEKIAKELEEIEQNH